MSYKEGDLIILNDRVYTTLQGKVGRIIRCLVKTWWNGVKYIQYSIEIDGESIKEPLQLNTFYWDESYFSKYYKLNGML